MADETVTFWRNESIKHIATYGGSGAGLFSIVGYFMWEDFSKNSCLPSILRTAPCVPHMDVLGFRITNAEQFGLFIAVACLLGCLALMALTSLTSKPTT